MKILLSAALLISLSGIARAVHPPTADDKAAMDKALTAARAADTDRGAKLGEYLRVSNPDAGFSPAEVKSAQAAWRLAENKREKAANAALAAIVAAYDIHPTKTSTNAAAGLYENRLVTWSPKFGEMLTNHVYLDERGKKIGETHLNADAQYMGITWADGQIIITPDALFKFYERKPFSPGMIAAIIYHETVHFNQLTDSMTAQHLTSASMEFAAHTAMESHRSDFQLTSGEMSFISAALKKSLENNLQNPNVLMMGPVSLEPAPAGDIDGAVAEERRKAQEEAARQKQIQNAAIDADLRTKLADIAVRACADGSVTQADLDALTIRSDNSFLIGKMPGSVTRGGCPQALFMSLGIGLSRGRRPTMDEVESITGARVRNDAFIRNAQILAEERAASDDFARASREQMEQKAAFEQQREDMFAGMRMTYVLRLKDLSEKACGSPDAISEYEAYALNGLAAYSSNFAPTEAQVSAVMSGCAKNVFDRIVELAATHRLDGGLHAEFARQLGRYYTPAPEPVAPERCWRRDP